MREKYLDVLKKHNIKYFYHFTSINNLDSILENGICNRLYMDKIGIKYNYTDKNRFDNQMGCIRFSLDYVNKSMLLYKQKRSSNDWVIIQLDAEKILTNFYDKIYYCKYNASSPSVIKILNNNKNYLKTIQAFNNMFDESRKLNFQAEMLLESNISCEYVQKIYVDSLQTKFIVQQLIEDNNYKNIEVIIKKEMF